MSVEEIVNNLKDGDNVAAGKAYDSVMAEKLKAALDAKKIELAPTMAGVEPVVQEVEPMVEPEQSGEIAQDEINNWVCRPRSRYHMRSQ